MTGYRGQDGDTEPVPFEYEPELINGLLTGLPGYYTKDGSSIYINTHFKTEREAWDSILRSVDAVIRLSASSVDRAVYALKIANESAARAVVEYAAAHRNYEAWREKQAQPTDPSKRERDQVAAMVERHDASKAE